MSLQVPVLLILHNWDSGMHRTKQLACTAVYWLRIDEDIVNHCMSVCTAPALITKTDLVNSQIPHGCYLRNLGAGSKFMGSNWLVIN